MAEAIDQTEEEVVIDPNDPQLFIEEEVATAPVEINPVQFPAIPPEEPAPVEMPSTPSPEQERADFIDKLNNVNKIDIDFDTFQSATDPKTGEAYSEEYIARYVVEERFPQFKPGDYDRIVKETGGSPKQILENFTNYRSVGPFATVMEEFGKAAGPGSAAVIGATIAGNYGAVH